jgi:hypothetical protein
MSSTRRFTEYDCWGKRRLGTSRPIVLGRWQYEKSRCFHIDDFRTRWRGVLDGCVGAHYHYDQPAFGVPVNCAANAAAFANCHGTFDAVSFVAEASVLAYIDGFLAATVGALICLFCVTLLPATRFANQATNDRNRG